MKPLINTSKLQYAKPVVLLITLSMLSSIWSCHQDPAVPPEPIEPIDLLPPLTMEGNNTFGALVNGSAFYSTSTTLVFAQYPSSNNLFVSGTMKKDTVNQGMSFGINDRVFVGSTYDLVDFGINCVFANVAFFESGKETTCVEHEQGNLVSGSAEIVYINIVERVVAGRFEMTFVEDGCDTIRITDGRFDAIIQFM